MQTLLEHILHNSDSYISQSFDYKSAALDYVGKQWGVPPSQALQFDSAVGGASKTYAFLRQQQVGNP